MSGKINFKSLVLRNTLLRNTLLCCATMLITGKAMPDATELLGLINEANKKQAEFQKLIENTPFENENLKSQFNSLMTTIKNQMKKNKGDLEKRAQEYAEEQAEKFGTSATPDQVAVIKMASNIKWLTEYYEVINEKLIPLETEILEQIQKIDGELESESFQKQFDKVFQEEIMLPEEERATPPPPPPAEEVEAEEVEEETEEVETEEEEYEAVIVPATAFGLEDVVKKIKKKKKKKKEKVKKPKKKKAKKAKKAKKKKKKKKKK